MATTDPLLPLASRNLSMTKRRDTTSHEECLRHFCASLRTEIKSDLSFWQANNPDAGERCRFAYSRVVGLLRDSAKATGVPLQDLGLEDYEVPKLRDADFL